MIKKLFLLGLLFCIIGYLVNTEAGAMGSEKIKRLEKRLEKLEKIEKSRYKKGEKEIISYYKNGFKMRTLDDQFKFQVGGRIQHDWGFFSECRRSGCLEVDVDNRVAPPGYRKVCQNGV